MSPALAQPRHNPLRHLLAPPPAAGTASAAHGSPAAQQQWSLGTALARQGRHAQAAQHFERAVKLAPRVALYWMNLASVQRKLFRPEAAIESARRAFELTPDDPMACHQLAELLRMNSRDAEALQVLSSLDPAAERSARHWLMLGSVNMNLARWQDAAIAFLQVLQEKPADIESYMQLGFALSNLKRYAEGAECLRTVSILEPAHFGAAVYAAHYAAWACDWAQGRDDAARLQGALALQSPQSPPTAFSPFCLLSMNDDAAMHRDAAAIEARRIREHVLSSAGMPAFTQWPAATAAVAAGRTRIGFVSADFRVHATSLLLVQTLERLDRSRFEVVLYSHGPDDASPLRARLVAAADRLVECREMNAAEQARRIHDDGIALLVDLSGYTANTRLGVFALRPAPVQALWLAYPSTTGADFVDYLIGDPVLTPMDHAADFSECIAQLPLCYEPTDEQREHPEPLDRAECGLPEDAFVYACFNQSYKITEEVFSRWCRILHQVPGSVLWLLVPQEDIQQALHAHAAERGIAPERVIFAPFVSNSRHLARLPQADLFLDTFPYGAHTTCSDALWMGLPVLTQLGRSFSARVAASLLAAVDLPAMAVASAEAYEQRAVALATHERDALTAMRDHLWDNRMDLPLFDNQRFTGELGALVERMVGRWAQGLPPAPLPAQA